MPGNRNKQLWRTVNGSATAAGSLSALSVCFRVGGGCADGAVCDLQAATARPLAINLPGLPGLPSEQEPLFTGKELLL